MNTQNFNPDDHPKVFISYSWDSREHINRILALADRLRLEGVDCDIDQYYRQIQLLESWPTWMRNQIKNADFVLLVCTQSYYKGFWRENYDGQGVPWEGAIITQDLYRKQMSNDKYIPVFFTESGNSQYIPELLRSSSYYELDRQYEELYRHLTNQPDTPKAPLGKVQQLSPRERTQYFVEEIQKYKPQIQLESTGRDKKVSGDKITVGNISNSQGVAIGRQASATVNITNQLQNSSNPEAQKLGKLLEQLQVEIEKEDSGLIPKNRDKALKHLETIGKFGGERQNSDLRDQAETALDALPTILNQGTGLNKTHLDTLLATIKENLGL